MKYFIFGLVLFLFGCTGPLSVFNETPKFKEGQCVQQYNEFGDARFETFIDKVGVKNYRVFMYNSKKQWISNIPIIDPIWYLNTYIPVNCPNFEDFQ